MTALSCVACIDDSSHLVKRPKQSTMSESRLWTKSFATSFIELYKQSPCLWQQKSKDYKNTTLRNRAYAKLVEFCQTVYPEADRDFVLKKIHTLRGNFRKEYNKVMSNKPTPSGNVYVPSLWYYNLMLFTVEQGSRSPSKKSPKRVSKISPIKIKREQNESSDEMDLDDEDDSDDDYCEMSEIQYMDSQSNQLQEPHSTDQSRAYSTQSNATDRKRKSSCPETTYESGLSDCPCRKHDVDEFEATGISVTKKLRRMDAFQAICAEFLINSILKRGLLKTLLPSTTLCDSQCNSLR